MLLKCIDIIWLPSTTMPKQSAPSQENPKTSARKSWKNTATIKDVARVTGLSAMTVSRALNTPELVRPETIKKIQEAIEQTGYIPNLLAGGLVSKRSRLIAAVVPQLNNAMFVDTLQSLGDELGAHGYQLLLAMSGHPNACEEDLISAILSRRPEGIVLTGVNHTEQTRRQLASANIPVVETWDLTPTPIDILVGFSHEKIGEAIAEYLLKKGYRRFALIGASDERGSLRQKGLTSFLNKYGIMDIPTSLVPAPSSLEFGRRGLKELLEAGHQPEVVICSSDAYALGVLIEANARGIAVPGQLAIMGFGDLDLSASAYPALSTVHIDKREMGIKAARALIARIEGKPLKDTSVDVGFRLIEREST